MPSTAEQAIYNRLISAPLFHPSTASLVANDWSLEPGDIVTVNSGEESYNVPVYSLDFHWTGSNQNGSCAATTTKVTIESTGGQTREPLPELRRREYANASRAYGSYNTLKKQNEEEFKKYETKFTQTDEKFSWLATESEWDELSQSGHVTAYTELTRTARYVEDSAKMELPFDDWKTQWLVAHPEDASLTDEQLREKYNAWIKENPYAIYNTEYSDATRTERIISKTGINSLGQDETIMTRQLQEADRIGQVLGVTGWTWEQVTPRSGDNPSTLSWYELVNGVYKRSTDTSVVPGKTYYVPKANLKESSAFLTVTEQGQTIYKVNADLLDVTASDWARWGVVTEDEFTAGGIVGKINAGTEKILGNKLDPDATDFAAWGVYTGNTLTGGVLVEKLNDNSTVTQILGSRINARASDLATWGVYSEDTLTAGVIAEKLSNSSNAYIQGDQVYIGNIQFSYSAATVPSGSNPRAMDLFELKNGAYVLTKDESPVSGKTYYNRSIAATSADDQFTAVGRLIAGKVDTNDLTANYTTTANLQATYATITELNGVKGRFNNLLAGIEVATNILSDSFQGAHHIVNQGGYLRLIGSNPGEYYDLTTSNVPECIRALQFTVDPNNSGRIILQKKTIYNSASWTNEANFNIADTQFYQDGVSAAGDNGWVAACDAVIIPQAVDTNHPTRATITLPTYSTSTDENGNVTVTRSTRSPNFTLTKDTTPGVSGNAYIQYGNVAPIARLAIGDWYVAGRDASKQAVATALGNAGWSGTVSTVINATLDTGNKRLVVNSAIANIAYPGDTAATPVSIGLGALDLTTPLTNYYNSAVASVVITGIDWSTPATAAYVDITPTATNYAGNLTELTERLYLNNSGFNISNGNFAVYLETLASGSYTPRATKALLLEPDAWSGNTVNVAVKDGATRLAQITLTAPSGAAPSAVRVGAVNPTSGWGVDKTLDEYNRQYIIWPQYQDNGEWVNGSPYVILTPPNNAGAARAAQVGAVNKTSGWGVDQALDEYNRQYAIWPQYKDASGAWQNSTTPYVILTPPNNAGAARDSKVSSIESTSGKNATMTLAYGTQYEIFSQFVAADGTWQNGTTPYIIQTPRNQFTDGQNSVGLIGPYYTLPQDGVLDDACVITARTSGKNPPDTGTISLYLVPGATWDNETLTWPVTIRAGNPERGTDIAATVVYVSGVYDAGKAAHNVVSFGSITLSASDTGSSVTKYPAIRYANGDGTNTIPITIDASALSGGSQGGNDHSLIGVSVSGISIDSSTRVCTVSLQFDYSDQTHGTGSISLLTDVSRTYFDANSKMGVSLTLSANDYSDSRNLDLTYPVTSATIGEYAYRKQGTNYVKFNINGQWIQRMVTEIPEQAYNQYT